MSAKMLFHHLALSLVAFHYTSIVSGLYDSSSEVIDLNSSNFNNRVINSDEIWIVEFYAPWCGHCQQLVPEYKKAANALKGIIKVGAVNADDHKSVGGQYGVKGFPTIKIFGLDKNKPQDYQGGRSAQGLIDAALQAAKSAASARLSGKKSGEGGNKSSGKAGDPADVVELTDSNFDELVLNSDDMWLVEFFAPWCGHCKTLAPHWAEAATTLKGEVKLGALDATIHTIKAQEYGIQGFPTIKYFAAGPKDKGSEEDYGGGRTAGDIVNWATEKLAENMPAPEVKQLIDDTIIKSTCGDSLCVVSVLPHILDCQSECRNNYLSVLNKLGEKFKKHMWGWVWSEAVVQSDLEEAFGLGGFGYPAMVVLSPKKMQYAMFKGSFSYEGINEFLRELSYGRGSTSPVRGAKLPTLKTIVPWDGEDGVLEVEEDIDLSDMDLDDMDGGKDEL